MTDAVDNLPARAARDAVLRAKYHSLVEKYLSNGKAHAFSACTGFGATTCWVQMTPPSSGNGSPTRTEAFCKLVCSQRNGHNHLHECGRRWHDSLTCEGSGSLRFTCPFGVRNFWVRLCIRDLPVVMVVTRSLGMPLSARAKRNAERLGVPPHKLDPVRARLPTTVRADFDRCTRLIELVADDVTQHVENDLQREELVRAVRALESHEVSETQLRKTLNHVLPYMHETPAAPEANERGDQMARRALEYVHRNFHRSLSLPEVADTVRLSACHFSTVFTQHVGVSLRDYLKGLRLEKAQELLHNPILQIAEVAQAVGYADPNSFRQAFKAQTGLSPTLWRETLHAT